MCSSFNLSFGHHLPHVDVPHLDPNGVVDDPVHDRLGMCPSSHAAVPLVNRVLGAVDGRRVVVAPLGELEEEVHLVGRRLVDEGL